MGIRLLGRVSGSSITHPPVESALSPCQRLDLFTASFFLLLLSRLITEYNQRRDRRRFFSVESPLAFKKSPPFSDGEGARHSPGGNERPGKSRNSPCPRIGSAAFTSLYLCMSEGPYLGGFKGLLSY